MSVQVAKSITKPPLSIMSSSFRYVDDVLRALKDISDELDALQNMARKHRVILRSSAITERAGEGDITLNINRHGGLTINNSPNLKAMGLKKEDLESMKKNYIVIRETYRKFNDLIQIENEFKTKFAGALEAPKVIALIRQLRFKAQNTLDDAFNFLQEVARRSMPPAMEKFCKEFEKMLRGGLKFREGNRYTYIYEDEGTIVFTEYMHLKDLVDDNGQTHPNKFVTVSYRVGGPAPAAPFFINVLDQYQPPGEFPLGRGAINVKYAQRILAIMLEQDRFATSLGKLPLQDVMNPGALKPSMFLYESYIQKIESTENELTFVLKNTVKKFDGELISKISNQLFREMTGHTQKRRVRLAMSVEEGSVPIRVVFMFVTDLKGKEVVTVEDLQFLKERFNLDDADIHMMVERINRRH